jgi:hypothetical protein
MRPPVTPSQPCPTLPVGMGELDRRAIETVRELAMDAAQKAAYPPMAPNRPAMWRSTRTSRGPATPAAPRASSPPWPNRSADAARGTNPYRLFRALKDEWPSLLPGPAQHDRPKHRAPGHPVTAGDQHRTWAQARIAAVLDG